MLINQNIEKKKNHDIFKVSEQSIIKPNDLEVIIKQLPA